MKFLRPHNIFEQQKHPNAEKIERAMKTTPEGKDLLALASDYNVVRTGRLYLRGLRGVTYVEQQSDGRWKHWVVATGRTYGEGYHDTLEKCLRNIWTEYVLDSTSVRPMGMNKVEYVKKIEPQLPALMGKGLDHTEIAAAVKEILLGGFTDAIRHSWEILEVTKWQGLAQFLGFKEIRALLPDAIEFVHIDYEFLGKNSPFCRIFNPNGPDIQTEIRFSAHPWEDFRFSGSAKPNFMGLRNANFLQLEYGGDGTSLPKYADKFWEKLGNALIGQTKKMSIVPEGSTEAAATAYLLAADMMRKTKSGEGIEQILLNYLNSKEFYSSSIASIIHKLYPKVWQKFLETHPDKESMSSLPSLADFGFDF